MATKRKAGKTSTSGRDHPIHRATFWAGVGLLILATVMAVRDWSTATYLATGLGGTLAVLLE